MHTTPTIETGQETLQLNTVEHQSSPKRMPQYDTTRATRIQEDWDDGWTRHSKPKAHTSSQSSVVTNQINQRQHNQAIHSLQATL
jgi:hypothetical protein